MIREHEVEALAELLAVQLAAIDAGDLDATNANRERLVGAVTVLRIVLGDNPDDVPQLLIQDRL